MKTTQQRVRDYMDAKGMSQAEFAKAVGVSQDTVSRMFRGSLISRHVALRLAIFFKVSEETILKGSRERVGA